MIRSCRTISCITVMVLITALLRLPVPVAAQDLVATDDLAGGSSVFVFRESRKKPQAKLAVGRVSVRRAYAPTNAQIAAAAQKRRLAAIAARKKAAAVAAANRKIALSNTLTAKAEGFLDGGQTDAAITNYRDALIQNPKNTRAQEGLSNALTAKGIDLAGDSNDTRAIAAFDEAIKLDPKNDVAYAKLGAIYDASGDDAKAIENYEHALKLNPEYNTLYLPLAQVYFDKGELARSEEMINKASSSGLQSVELDSLKGRLLLRQNKNAEAIAVLDAAIARDPKNSSLHYYRGQALERLSKPSDAISAYQRAVELDENNTAAAFDLGVAYYNAGDYRSAAAQYEKIVKREPKNYQAHANLASTYRQLERFADANAEYKLASEGIKTADLYSEWGYCLGKTNEWDKSVARLETAKEISPSAIDNSNVGWAYYNAGNAAAQAKNEPAAKENYSKAKVHLEAAVQQDPRFDAALLNLGSTHNKLGEFQAAVAVLQTVLGLRKDWVIAVNQLGVGYRGLNDLTNAIVMFKRVTDLETNNVYGLYNLGEAYNAIGNKKEAKKVNDRLRKVDPSMAARLDGVISGKIVIDAAKQKIENKLPRIPKFP